MDRADGGEHAGRPVRASALRARLGGNPASLARSLARSGGALMSKSLGWSDRWPRRVLRAPLQLRARILGNSGTGFLSSAPETNLATRVPPGEGGDSSGCVRTWPAGLGT